ncbi:MAG: Crp/Fnr family transcriptional regulator, partial [Steroidobacteraceae bacterium]
MLSQPHVPGRTQTLTSGSVLYTPGDSLPVVMRVLEGTVKLLAHLENGDSRIVRIKRRGDWLGLQALANGAVPHTAVAVGEVLIERWPAERLRGLIDGDRQLLDQLLRQWQDEVAEADRWLTEFSTGAVPARIA